VSVRLDDWSVRGWRFAVRALEMAVKGQKQREIFMANIRR